MKSYAQLCQLLLPFSAADFTPSITHLENAIANVTGCIPPSDVCIKAEASAKVLPRERLDALPRLNVVTS